MTGVELAHISDLHVPLQPGRERWTRYLNKRLLGWLNLKLKRSHPLRIVEAALEDLRARPPDHLAVTGDLTNLGFESEFERAGGLLAQVGLRPEQFTVIPGNHDAYVRDSWEAGAFARTFGPLQGEEALAWPRLQRRGPLALVSASSAVPSPPFAAWGLLGRAQLEALDALLGACAEAPLRLLLVHHPPLIASGRPDRWLRRNREGAELLELCRRHGVRAVLCGHTHRAFSLALPGSGEEPLRVLCAGSTTQDVARLGAGATYNRYRIEDGRLAGVEVRGYDPATGAFRTLREEAYPAP